MACSQYVKGTVLADILCIYEFNSKTMRTPIYTFRTVQNYYRQGHISPA